MSFHKADESSYSIDYFHGKHNAYFLTHVHTDHLVGLHDGWRRGTIYCSEQTSALLSTLFSIDCDVIRTLPLEFPSIVKLSRNTSITVTFVDANHCPGSVMIKISGEFGCRLHSGDFRYSSLHHCDNASLLGVQHLFLDTTFFHPSWRMPTKEQSCSRLLDLIEREGNNKTVYIAADCYGQEDIFIAIHARYGQKIMLDVDHPGVSGRTKSIWKNWLTKVDSLKNIVTQDEGRFRACASNGKGVNKRLRDAALNIFALAKRDCTSSLLIRASTLWFGSRDRFEHDERVER
jgi:hypothetical protein